MSLFDDLDLGAGDYDKEKDPGLNQFTSKPIQRQYQPFGGQMPQNVQSPVVQDPVQYEQPQPQPQPQPYQNFNDYDLDAYEQAKKQHSQISQYARENKRSASHYGTLYDDFKKNEFTPYFESVGGFGDFDTDEEYINAVDEMYKSDLKNSQQEDGFFGASDAKLAAQENLKKYASWNQPNGMRDKFLRLKAERDRRKAVADQAEAMEYALFEQMTSIPIPQREALDAGLKSRTAKPRSKKATDEMLNQMQFDSPKYFAGELLNPESIDPRAKVKSSSIHTNPATQQRQRERMAAAMRGDIAGFLSRRQSVAKDRQLRDKGFMFSTNGQIDGRPIGMSRKDTDLLDLEEMKKAGMTEYKGQPIEQAIESLGGMERMKVAKVMQSVYAAKSNYEDVQLEYLKNSGGAKGDALREKMEAAREEVNKTIGLAAQFGLDNELFEQAETTGWLSAIGNAVKRGLLMSEMSNYTPDFLTNTLDADEMQRFIEIASEIEELPTSSTMKRVKSTKSDGFLDAMGNLLFDNPAAIPEMFVGSMASLLPSAIKWMLPTAATGAATGFLTPVPGGAATGAALGARASWGAASFVLEASGMALEGMQELGIDWKNPKIFAAAWTNESIRNKIQKKMVQKGTPIAVADMLTGMMAGKVMAIANHTDNAMFKGGKLLNKSQFNKTAGAVPRFTKFQKTRNAAAELGADSLMGMSGEYLGQWASKEPGEDWDWDAIAAEGIVGVGPGVLSSALEMRSRSGNYFGNAPIEITGEQMTETGSMGTVTRAGYSAPYQTFNDAESMMAHLQTVEGVNPESLEFTQNWVERMYAANPEEMSKLKIAFSPRTPDANLKNRGTFEARDGHNIMYINEKEFAADPMGAFMHESGHFARIMVMSDQELRSAWGGLGEDSQLEAYTQYFTKKPDATFDSLDEKTQKKVRRAFDRTPDDVLAEEWFSYQWGRVLMGYTADKNVAKPLKNFKDKVIHPILGEYAGTENLAGGKSEQGYILDQKILQFLGYENGMPDPKVPDEGGTPSSSTPQTKEQAERKLNAMPGTPQEKSKIAKAVNAMLGADILTESPSAYSSLQNLNTKLAQEETPEDPEKVADAAPAFTGEKEKETTVKIEGERPKAPAEKVPDVVENKSLNNKIGAIQRKLGKLQRQGNEGSPEKIKNRNKAIARYKKDLESLIQQGVKRGEKLGKPEDTVKKVEKRAAEKKADKEVEQKVTVEEKEKKTFKRGEITKETPRKANTPETIAKEETEARNKGLTKDRIDREVAYRKFVNSLLPNNKRKRDVELYKTLQANKELVSNQYKLDKRIVEIQKSLGPNASTSRIISELLNLRSIARLAPESIAAKIRKAVEPDASSSKPPSSKDVEDTAAEITDRLEVIKDLLRTELDRIDKDIASLETGLAPQPAVSSNLQDRMTEQIADAIKPSAKKYLSKEQVKTKVATQFIGEGVNDSSTDRYHKMYQSEGVANTGKYNSSDIIYVSSNGARGNRVNPVVDGNLQGEFKNIDKAIKAGAAFIMDTYDHLVKTKRYNIGELALGNYLKSKGYKRVGRSGIWTKDGKAPQPAAQGQGPKKKKEKAESPGFIEVDGKKVLTPKIEDEIAEMRRARKLVEVAIDMIAPEEATIEWKDVPHSQYWYKPKFQKGPIRRLTLGMLAENRDFNKITILDRYKEDTVGEDTRSPQEILWDWVTTEFDPDKGSETTGTKNAYYGLVTEYDIKTKKHTERPRTKSEYIMILEAVKASAMFTKKNNIGKKPMGTVRLKKNKKTGRMEEYGRGYPDGGYTTDRGATYAAVIAERIRSLMNTSAKDENGKPVKDENGMLVPVMERAPIVSTNPTLEDMIALKAANGRTLELLGDPSDSLAQFHAALFQIARDETLTERQTQIATPEEIKRIRKEFLTEEDRKKIRKPKRTFQSIASEVSDNQFEYAEDEGNPFPSVEGSKSLLASLIKIPSLSARQKFEKGYHDQIYRNLEKIDLGIELRIGYDIDVTAENAKKIEDYVNNNKLLDKAAKDEILGYKNELYRSGVELEKLRSNQIELTRDLEYFIAEPQEFTSESEQAQHSDHIIKKRRDDFIKKYFKNLNRFDYGNIQEYEYLEPFTESDNPTIEKRDGKYAHDEFDASEIHTPFDVIQAFSRGRERFDTPTNRAMLTENEKTELEKEAARVIRKMSASEFTKKYGERFKGLRREEVLPALNDSSDLGSRYSSRVVQSPDASGSTLLKENELVLNQDNVKNEQARQLFEELKTEIFKENLNKGDGRQDSIFRKNRTTIQKDELALAKENIMENADPSSSTNVTAVDIAEFFLAGSNPVKQMKKLELLPSSEVKGETLEGLNKLKQLPGGLGEGLLVYIFPKFLESMYSRLGIKDWSPKISKSKEPFNWQLEKGDLLFNGKPVQDFNMFIDEESRMSPEEMAVLVEPIVQAVIDARGLDIKNEYDKRQDALLQRNPLEGAETADERTDTSEMRDDSGNEEAKQVATLETVEDEAKRQQAQADAAKQLAERPELLKRADNSLIEELLNTENISRELRDVLTDEYARRNGIKEFEQTFTPKNRTLNADIGRRGFMKSMLMGFAAANIKTGAKVAGSAAPTDWSVLGRIMSEVSNDYDSADAASRDAYLDGGSAELVVREFVAHKKFLEVELENHKLWANFQIQVLSDSKLSEKEKTEKIEKAKKEYLKTDEFGDMWRGADQNHRIPRHFSLTPWYAEGTTNAEIVRSIKKEYATHKEFVQGEIQQIKEDAEWNLEQYAVVKDGIASEKAKKYLIQAPSIFTSQALKSLFPKIPASSFKKLQSMPLKEAEQYVEKLLLENEKAQPSEINIQEERAKEEVPRTLNSDAGKQEMPMSPLNVYRSADEDFGFEEDFRLETTVGQELKKLGIKIDKNGVPYTDNKVAIKKGFPMILYRGIRYNPKTKTTGRPAEGVFFTREFETAEAYANGYKMSGNYEADMKAMDSYRDEIKANGEKLIVFSYLYQSPGNSLTKKAGIAPKQKELTVGTMEGPEDYNAMLEFGEYTFGSGTGERSYVLKTSQLSGLDGLLAAHEINADSSINEDGSTPKLIPFNEIPQNGLNPRELDKFEREDSERNLRNRTLNSDAGVFHGTRTNNLASFINKDGGLTFYPSSNFGGKVTGISFSNSQDTAEDYRTRSKTSGPKGRDLGQGWLLEIDPGALQEATYPLEPTDEIDNEIFFRTENTIEIPKGSWSATKNGVAVSSLEELNSLNDPDVKKAESAMAKKSLASLLKTLVDHTKETEMSEFYQDEREIDYTNKKAAEKELKRRNPSLEEVEKVLVKTGLANENPFLGYSPSELAKFYLGDRTLNSDATLTSDVNPNLAKANLLSRIAGDSELKKNFDEWLKTKKDSDLAGSFMMSFVDQADPVKKIHRSLFDSLKDAGLDIAKGPMRGLYNVLNVHGKWHQYFGKGYDTVEQARILFIQPIKDAMLKYKIDQGKFGKYLLARAAPSRNQHLRDKVDRLREEAKGLLGEDKINALADIKEIYLNEDGTVKNSGISDQDAYNLISEYEKDANFVKFANEALDPYYNMNKESIDLLRTSGMIRESVNLEGVQEGISEYDRMVGAMSKIDLAKPNPDFNFTGSKVKLTDPKYSYSPMQGFEGETEAFFDAERAWDELGKGQNGSGKGWDQPKSTFLSDPAFGRNSKAKGPNPDTVLAVAINQFFDSAIRSHKNEVSQSFADMFTIMKAIAYPDDEGNAQLVSRDPQAQMALDMLSKLPKEQKDLIKEEFDKVFEKEFKKATDKNLYVLDGVKDGSTGEIVAKRKTLNAIFKQDPLVFVYRKNGVPDFIKFKNTQEGTRMARSMKNLKYEALPTVLSKFNTVTRFMARMFTSMNPAFIIPNFFRDLGTAFIHLTEDDKKKLVKDVFKFKNLKWISSIAKAELHISKGKDPVKELNITPTQRQKGQNEKAYAQAILKRGNKIEMYAYAKRNGAKIGYVRHDTVPELIRNIKKETGKSEGATKRRLKAAAAYVDAANTGVENSIRMSTFWAAINNGYTSQEAAIMSRNVTVDFNQKGELTQAFGSLYVFFGAAVNSTHRLMTTLNRRSRTEKLALVGGIATASFLVALFNRLMDDDEEELVPDYDTISSYKRDTNLIMPVPAGLPEFFNDKKDTGYFSIPLPLGYNLFWTMGQVIADTFANNFGSRGGSGIVDGGGRILQSAMNAFNPVGGSSIATIGTPTMVTPLIEVWANKNFMGREIRYKDDQFGVPEPGHMQDPKSTPGHWTALSKGLNEFFGGDDVIKGSLSGAFGSKSPLMYHQDSDIKFDISGNQMKHLFYGYLGGPGQLLDSAFGGLFSAAKGQASIDNIGQVPIVNRFMRGTTYGTHTRELYYNLRDAVKTAESAIKDAKKLSPKAYSLVNNDLRPLLSISGQLKAFEAQKNKFNRLKSKVESANNLTEEQKMQRIADIEEKQLNMMVKVIKKAQSLGIS